MDHTSIGDAREGTCPSQQQSPEPQETSQACADKIIAQYLLERVPEFVKLSDLRKQSDENQNAAKYFEQQRKRADEATEKRQKTFVFMMRDIAAELDKATGAFSDVGIENAKSPQVQKKLPKILDMCMAPGGFLAAALERNRSANALAFTLPVEMGGHKVWLKTGGRSSRKVDVREMGITMLAVDMGVPLSEIPADHEDHDNFLARQIESDRLFDLALCDGQVLRTHPRANYRKKTEASRLGAVQLAIALEHLRPGGTIVVLLHHVEALTTILLLRTFSNFSRIQLYKPKTAHRKKSSFYMLATEVDSRGQQAADAVDEWKAVWKAVWKAGTFSATYEDYMTALQATQPTVEEVLHEFGEQLIGLGRDIWANQAEALANARFMKAKQAKKASEHEE